MPAASSLGKGSRDPPAPQSALWATALLPPDVWTDSGWEGTAEHPEDSQSIAGDRQGGGCMWGARLVEGAAAQARALAPAAEWLLLGGMWTSCRG